MFWGRNYEQWERQCFSPILVNDPFKSALDVILSAQKPVLLYGVTGSGKTMLIDLIPRFYDATNGEVLVDGVNVVTKHQKPTQANPDGGIIQVEAPIDASNVMILDPKKKVPTRIGYTVNEKGVKVRVTKKSGTILDK